MKESRLAESTPRLEMSRREKNKEQSISLIDEPILPELLKFEAFKCDDRELVLKQVIRLEEQKQ